MVSKNIKFCDCVKIKPWIGDNYYSTSKKILIIGESHYNSKRKIFTEEELYELTHWTINEIAHNEWTHRFYTNIASLFKGEKILPSEKLNFWNGVCFYNYIQSIDIEQPGVAPTYEMFSSAINPFLDVVNKCEPNYIIIFSYRTWENLKRDLKKYFLLNNIESGCGYKKLKIEDNIYNIIAFPHPSRGFSREKWNQPLKTFLNI
ncbi:MAG: hypothetical protein JXN62_04370 [Bacteroidales bacterium]|nr:hypothetical protein [Bacteroidales bacterium]